MNELTRYGGAYLIDDFLLGRMGVSDARSFNDPFEFHFKPGKPLSRGQAKQRIRCASERPAVKAQYEEIAKKVGRKRMKETLRANKKLMVEAIISGDAATMNDLRDHIFTFTDEVAKIVCCTQPDVGITAENAMWAYYAGNHGGVRLHLHESFFKPLQRWFPIKYENDPPAYEAWTLDDVEGIQRFVIDVLGRKFKAWSHEQEVRLLIPVHQTFIAKDCNGVADRCYTELLSDHVRRIDLGIRYSDPEKACERLKKKFSTVEVFQAKKSLESYQIAYERIG